MRHLLFLSGGPDSTYSLKKVLTECSDPVVVCFVSMNDPFGRSVIEEKAAELIMAYCRGVFRGFEYKRGEIFLPSPYQQPDVTLMAPFASALCNGYRDIGKLWMGCDSATGHEMSAQEHFRRATMNMMLEPRHGVSFPLLQYPEFEDSVTKRECREYLGETLWSLTWSCRMPKQGELCGTCFACVARAKGDQP